MRRWLALLAMAIPLTAYAETTYVTFLLPSSATLKINGVRTAKSGDTRTFETNRLPTAGWDTSVIAGWVTSSGKPVVVSHEFHIYPGKTYTVDLNAIYRHQYGITTDTSLNDSSTPSDVEPSVPTLAGLDNALDFLSTRVRSPKTKFLNQVSSIVSDLPPIDRDPTYYELVEHATYLRLFVLNSLGAFLKNTDSEYVREVYRAYTARLSISNAPYFVSRVADFKRPPAVVRLSLRLLQASTSTLADQLDDQDTFSELTAAIGVGLSSDEPEKHLPLILAEVRKHKDMLESLKSQPGASGVVHVFYEQALFLKGN